MRLPFTHLLVRESKSVAITAGGHICVFETSTGRSLSSTTERTDVKLGPVISADVCGDGGEYLVTATEDKALRVWRTDDLNLVSERTAVKKPTSLKVTKDGSTILISDKFGDVYSFSINPPEDASKQESSEIIKRTKLTSLESLGGKLLMGHVSLLTTFLLTPDEKYIVTADRDEHIRASWYPESYVIESYCLGQKKFVSALHIPSWDSSLLLSGGGDPEIKLWNWMEGELIAKYDVANAVLPFVKVIRRRTSGGEGSGDEGEGDGEKQLTKAQKRKLRKKGKGKEGVTDDAPKQEGEGDDASNNMDVDCPSTSARASSAAVGDEKDNQPTLAISKIESLESPSQKLCLFSAIGATALFYFELPDATQPSSSSDVTIKHYDLGKPVLDFYLLRESGEIWVLTDGECNEESISSTDPTPMVRVLRLDSPEFKEFSESAAHPDLQKALNSSNIQSASDATVDLYALLASLPKHTGGESNIEDDTLEAQEISKKEQGRMKAKRARDAITLKRASEPGDAGNPPADERDVKKSRSES